MEVTTKRFIKMSQKKLNNPGQGGDGLFAGCQTCHYLELIDFLKELSFNATRFKTGGSSSSCQSIFQKQPACHPSIREISHESGGGIGVIQPILVHLIRVYLLTNVNQFFTEIGNQKATFRYVRKSRITTKGHQNSPKDAKRCKNLHSCRDFHHDAAPHRAVHQILRFGDGALQRQLPDQLQGLGHLAAIRKLRRH